MNKKVGTLPLSAGEEFLFKCLIKYLNLLRE